MGLQRAPYKVFLRRVGDFRNDPNIFAGNVGRFIQMGRQVSLTLVKAAARSHLLGALQPELCDGLHQPLLDDHVLGVLDVKVEEALPYRAAMSATNTTQSTVSVSHPHITLRGDTVLNVRVVLLAAATPTCLGVEDSRHPVRQLKLKRERV